jgi:branched-chain amino acid transport system ATP-binding protein
MAKPKPMLLDEPSALASPAIVQAIRNFAQQDGRSVLLGEQNVRAALRISDCASCMRAGQFILEEPGDVALARRSWWDLF